MTQQPSVHLEESSVQLVVYDLEAYKRRLGRNFDQATDHHTRVWYFNRYNDTENTIQWLCATYNLKRKHKPHKLKFENV